MAGSRSPGTGLAAAIFDMDGLLIDSEPLWRRAEMEIFARLGVTLSEEDCLETRGMLVTDVARYWYRRRPWEGPGPQVVAAEMVEAMASLLSAGVALKTGAAAALDACRRQGLVLAVASSSPRRLIDVVVGRSGWSDLFSVIHSGQDEKAGKPDPAVFLTAARLLGVDPARCVVFEDSPAGIRAAVAAGMVCVAIPEQEAVPTSDGASALALADIVLGTLDEVDDELWSRLTRPTGGR
ncbi:MAG: hexitol phosphatase HxpB [Acidimicrobiales bacterium]